MNQQVFSFLSSTAAAVTEAPAVVLERLLVPVVRLKPGKWTWVSLSKQFGRSVITPVADAVREHDRLAYDMLAGSGVDFSDPETQAAIDQLRTEGVILPEIAAALKALGVETLTTWAERAGANTPLPTQAEIAEAQAELVRRRGISDIVTRIADEVTSPAVNAGKSVAETRAAVIAFVQSLE